MVFLSDMQQKKNQWRTIKHIKFNLAVNLPQIKIYGAILSRMHRDQVNIAVRRNVLEVIVSAQQRVVSADACGTNQKIGRTSLDPMASALIS
jgi:hypothetical protein